MENDNLRKMISPDFDAPGAQPQYVPQAQFGDVVINDFAGMPVKCSYCHKKFSNAIILAHEEACVMRES